MALGSYSPGALTGWGRAAPSVATVARPRDLDDAGALVDGPGPRGVIARGLGRSYGDAAQNGGGTVVLMTRLDGIGELDPSVGRVRVEAGVSLDALMRALVPLGWFVPVSPGTRQVTIGGAVAADIHGKNHHRDGSFGDYVDEVELLAPRGRMTLRRDDGSGAFWATVGGMGLTGIIASVTLRLLRVETSTMRVDTDRAPDLDAAMALMEAGDSDYRYSVAWIDCMARGEHMGRSVLTRGDHATLQELGARARADPLRFAPQARVKVPPIVPDGLVNRFSIAAFNEAWFRKAPRHQRDHLESMASFFHPLDGVAGWNRLYGPRGFLQYQFVVPFEASEVVRHAVEAFSGAGTPSFLAVLKRFGAGGLGHLSFPMPGWTLALDIPAGMPGLGRILDRLDERVAAAGGRVYLAKDSRMQPDMLARMYPRLDEWRDVQAGLDPLGAMQSDLSRRLQLTGEGGR
ncbi:MAG: FAD-binding oxidoreductase [Candidatus Dormibacteria bacterium]